MKIFLASDHAGFELKADFVEFLTGKGYEVEDLGPFTFEPADDYPDFVRKVAEAVAADSDARGIVIGLSGQGEAMAANRFPRVRAAVYYGGALDIVSLAREHNDANILSIGARFVDKEKAMEALALFLSTPFSGEERHVRRIKKIERT